MTHTLDAYKDGFKWVVFCKVCGLENPEGKPCVPLQEKYRQRIPEKVAFKSGLP